MSKSDTIDGGWFILLCSGPPNRVDGARSGKNVNRGSFLLTLISFKLRYHSALESLFENFIFIFKFRSVFHWKIVRVYRDEILHHCHIHTALQNLWWWSWCSPDFHFDDFHQGYTQALAFPLRFSSSAVTRTEDEAVWGEKNFSNTSHLRLNMMLISDDSQWVVEHSQWRGHESDKSLKSHFGKVSLKDFKSRADTHTKYPKKSLEKFSQKILKKFLLSKSL